MPTRTFVVGPNIPFEVDERYDPIRTVGKGSFGIVCSCSDKQTGRRVAIKKVTKAFDNPLDAKRTLREIKLLRHMSHENIIPLLDIQPPPGGTTSYREFGDVYEVTELMEADLHKIIYSQQLSDDHCQCFLYQLMKALKYIHSAHIIHRDLKPDNLLVNKNCDLKLCDFGLARFNDDAREMTEYVVTRWYRAPELILTKHYDNSIDIWSAGCILAEMLLQRPLFKGDNYLHQIEVICEVLGTPTEADLWFIDAAKRDYIMEKVGQKARRPWASVLPQASPAALDLLDRIFQWDPRTRITAAESLEHAYLAEYHDPADEPSAEARFDFDFTYEEQELRKEQCQAMIWNEMLAFHPELIGNPDIEHPPADAGTIAGAMDQDDGS